MKTSTTLLVLLSVSLSLTDAAAVERAGRRAKRQTVTTNYSGASLKPSPDGSPFIYATTQINVPQGLYVSDESAPPTVQKAAAWVGFGPAPGTAAGSGGIIQTGCTFFNDGQQDLYSRCWYEFYPSPPVFYSGFEPAVGDTVQLEIYRDSDTTGRSVITDLTTGAAVSASFSGPSGHAVSGQNVEWIVENPQAQSNFVDFQKEFFEGCEATTSNGNTYGPGDGSNQIFNENKNGQQYTNSFLPSDSEVEVDWVGPAGTS